MATLFVIGGRGISKAIGRIHDLRKKTSEITVVSLCEKAGRILRKSDIPYKSLRNYYELPELQDWIVAQFDKTVELLKEYQKSTTRSGTTVNELFTYRGLPLWEVVNHQLALQQVAPLMNALALAMCIVDTEKPSEIILSTSDDPVSKGILAFCRWKDIKTICLQNRSIFSRIQQLYAKHRMTLLVQVRDILVRYQYRRRNHKFEMISQSGLHSEHAKNILFVNIWPGFLRTILPVMGSLKKKYNSNLTCILSGKIKTPRELMHLGIRFSFFEEYADWKLYWGEVPKNIKDLVNKWCGEIADSNIFRHAHVREAQIGELLLKEAILAYLRSNLPIVMRDFHTAKALLETEKPNVVVSAEDMSPLSRMFALIGKKMNIPSVRIQQETLIPSNGADWAFLISDKATVCGEYARNILINKRGIEPERLISVGQPRYDEMESLLNTRADVEEKYGIRERKRIALFASISPSSDRVPRLEGILSKDEYLIWLHEIYSALQKIDNCFVLVKPHPQKNDLPRFHKAVWKRVANGKRNICVTDRHCNILELISACDVLITWESITAIEAMLMSKPVVIVNLTGREDLMPYVRFGAALGAYNKAEISARINDALEDIDTRNKMRKSQEECLEQVFYDTDGQAARRAAAAIHTIIQESPSLERRSLSMGREE